MTSVLPYNDDRIRTKPVIDIRASTHRAVARPSSNSYEHGW